MTVPPFISKISNGFNSYSIFRLSKVQVRVMELRSITLTCTLLK